MTDANVQWCNETQTLSGSITVDGEQIFVRIPRQMIHSIPIYNDAVGWEIERFKLDIVERLLPRILVSDRDLTRARET